MLAEPGSSPPNGVQSQATDDCAEWYVKLRVIMSRGMLKFTQVDKLLHGEREIGGIDSGRRRRDHGSDCG